MKEIVRFIGAWMWVLMSVQLVHSQGHRHVLDTSAYMEQANRIEFEYEDEDVGFTLINGGVDGLLVVKETHISSEEGNEWVLYKLDTTCSIQWTQSVIVPYQYNFEGWDYASGQYYLLFSTTKFTKQEYTMYVIASDSGEVAETSFNTVFSMILTHFEIMDHSILIAGSANARPVIMTYDLEELKPRVVPGVYGETSRLVDIHLNEDLSVYTVVMLDRTISKKYALHVRSFSEDNQLLQTSKFVLTEKLNFVDGIPSEFDPQHQFIGGAFSYKNSQYSSGLYFSGFGRDRQEFVTITSFSELESFFDYMSPKREERVRKRLDKKQNQGKESKFNQRVFIHDLIKAGDEFLLVGEAFYPSYASYQDLAVQEVVGPTNNQNKISGYKYTHAFVVAFDQNGKRLWDRSFPLEDVFSEYLKETVQVFVDDEKIEMHYMEENTIRSMILDRKELTEQIFQTTIRVENENEEMQIDDPVVEGLEIWFDNVLYAYGDQVIENLDPEAPKKKREIFYINKVRYNPQEFIE
jgi:hypothetical protein